MKKAVIIGGGFAGSTVAKKLEKHFEVVLIDAKDYFEFTPGILREIVFQSKGEYVQGLHRNYLRKAGFIKGVATSIDEKNVFLGRKKISYDYLVICSGSGYAYPIKEQGIVLADRMENLKKSHYQLENSKKIAIIGGGLVGVELAGEICTKYDKEITIIHGAERLIERNPKKASEYSRKFLEKRGVKILFNEFFREKKGDYCITDKGTEVKSDLVFLCTGMHSNSDFMQKNFKKSLNEKGQIEVDEFLNVRGSRNIFAVGDVNDLLVEKTAQNSILQAEIVARNIISIEKSGKLKEYKPKRTSLVISLGRDKGIFVWKNFAVFGFIPALMKKAIQFFYMIKYRRQNKAE